MAELLDGRIEALGGSFFDKVPDGAEGRYKGRAQPRRGRSRRSRH
jgi:hypothetical protein